MHRQLSLGVACSVSVPAGIVTVLFLFVLLFFFAVGCVHEVSEAVLAQVEVELVNQVLHEVGVHHILDVHLFCRRIRVVLSLRFIRGCRLLISCLLHGELHRLLNVVVFVVAIVIIGGHSCISLGDWCVSCCSVTVSTCSVSLSFFVLLCALLLH